MDMKPYLHDSGTYYSTHAGQGTQCNSFFLEVDSCKMDPYVSYRTGHALAPLHKSTWGSSP